jgi:DNA helicase II / ATP-dependent DNA helicase PcrA
MTIAPAQQTIIDEEVTTAEQVVQHTVRAIASVSEDKRPLSRTRNDAEMIALRDLVADAHPDDLPALVAQMMRIASVQSIDQPRLAAAVDPQNPYFGRLRLREGKVTRDVLIGKRGLIDREAGIVIVDWRNAPVSRIYYRYEEGDDYEEELGEQVREGVVVARRTMSFSQGRLLRIRCPAGTFSRGGEGDEEWVALERTMMPELAGGMGKAERAPSPDQTRLGLGNAHLRSDKHLPEITALIDGKQFDAMTQASSSVVLLQGGAGSGKTTVALHRVAWLTYSAPAEFRPSKILVVVAQRSLVKYIERVLPSLDVQGVRVMAVLDWQLQAVRRVTAKHMRPMVREVSLDVLRAKKHPAMWTAVQQQLHRRMAEARAMLLQRIEGRPQAETIVVLFDRDAHLAAVPRLRAFINALDANRFSSDLVERARKAVEPTLRQITDVVAEWEELITDDGVIVATEVEPSLRATYLAHTKRQIEEFADEDVDDDRKRPVDGRVRDDDEPQGSFDVSDLPLLLCMQLARHGALVDATGQLIEHDHVVIDEAQDLSAMDIRPLLAATGDRKSMTLAGDVVQKIVFDNHYDTWAELEQQLDVAAANVEPLRLSYRSTHEVVAFAREVLGPLAPIEPPKAVRGGAPVQVFSFTDTGAEVAFLADQLRGLMAREPQANVALLCRYPERARFFYDALKEAEVPRMSLVLPSDSDESNNGGDDFSFAPGIDITTIAKVKGLEYDYVIVLEATAAMYPAQVPARLLHIAATRAAHQLWLTTSVDSPSPLLPSALLVESQI